MHTLIAAILLALAATPGARHPDPAVRLGERLFADTRFSNSNGDMATSCVSCHMPADVQGDRAFTQFLSRSWRPSRTEDPARETLRNAPTLFDTAQMPLLHHDGQFTSLEEQTRETLIGRNMGWLPEERGAALDHLKAILQEDAAYRQDFSAAMQVDVDADTAEALTDAAARAVAAFMRTLESPRDTPYDTFIAANGFDPGPKPGEPPSKYGERMLWAVIERMQNGTLTRPAGFSEEAIAGYKVFLRTSGATQAGNCVACHVPPAFSDFQFHNTGVAQEEYERTHGESTFLSLSIPAAAAAQRPSPQFMARPGADCAECADLGYWNFARASEGEAIDDTALTKAIGAFKTPSLRHLASTAPYMHNGKYLTLEAVILQKARAGNSVRDGGSRNPDPEIAAIRLDENDVRNLFAFLNTLNAPGGRRASPAPLEDDSSLLATQAAPYRGY
ncbi:MAG: hypothetical protein HYV27_08630 [Candidatus Hydrogenedentes bacterium]|nr:hypothetical protein [Candidatus Hydrogenedentota bacterium]